MGIGDPQFSREERGAQLSSKPLFVSRGRVDANSIGALPRLPETRQEITSEAALFPAGKAVVLVGDDATERAVRQQRLPDFQIIAFATHAVVPGEIDGVSEPAIILTPGSEANNPMNDGALTASEIAGLPLDANVIVLSACNTAAPDDRRSGRGLSGFADAFFYRRRAIHGRNPVVRPICSRSIDFTRLYERC